MKWVASLSCCGYFIASFPFSEWSINCFTLPVFLYSRPSLYLFATQWLAPGSHIIPSCHVTWLGQKIAFYTFQGAALVKRRADKSPVAVHLHQFKYLTWSREQRHSLSLEVKHASAHYWHTDLCLSFVEHVSGGVLQVFRLRLSRVINVDRVGGILRQVHIVDGASFCLQLENPNRQVCLVAALFTFGTWLCPDFN